MSPPIRPEQETEAQRTAREVEAWQTAQEVREYMARRENPNRPKSANMRAVGAAIREDVNRRERQPVGVLENLANLSEMVSDASTFGLSGLALDTFNSRLAMGDDASWERFRARRDARQVNREAMQGSDQLGAGIAGGLMNPSSAFLGPARAGAGALRIMGKGLLEGALQGGAQVAGENVGATNDPATGSSLGGRVGAGMAVGGLFGGAIAPFAAHIAGGASRMDPVAEAAARRAAEAARTDRALGHTVPVLPTGPGMPRPMDIDRVGPESIAQARGATRNTRGWEATRAPFEARMAEMPNALTGDAPDAITLGNQLRADRDAQASVDFPAAVEDGKGIPIDSPFLNKLLMTRAGRVAWAEIQAARPGMVLASGDPARALPVVTRTTPDGPVDEVFPDAEAVHEMTRWLRERSKTGKGQVPPDGVGSHEAGIALGLLEQTRNELPPLHRVAVDNYARNSEPISALEMGRGRWAVNPSPGKKADRMAVANVRSRMAKMSPEAQDMVRTGKQFDLATRVNEGKLTPAKAVKQLNRPNSTLAQEMDISGSPLPARLRAWNDVAERQSSVLPAKVPISRTGVLGIVRTGPTGPEDGAGRATGGGYGREAGRVAGAVAGPV